MTKVDLLLLFIDWFPFFSQNEVFSFVYTIILTSFIVIDRNRIEYLQRLYKLPISFTIVPTSFSSIHHTFPQFHNKVYRVWMKQKPNLLDLTRLMGFLSFLLRHFIFKALHIHTACIAKNIFYNTKFSIITMSLPYCQPLSYYIFD